ncbi:MAG TPA: acylase [Steroidobacteraceae bacterium]|jgi:penicillin amidase/acyl-homoserine-lactone acylase|nr:acylase [Steroidobacteraceae bacterium]
MRYLKIGAAALAALVLVGLITVIAQDRWNQPPEPARATLIAQAAHYHARIQRDRYGVPHISGPTDPDVAFGLAFAHSEDDFATIQQAALIARGQLASVEGAKGAVTDYLVRLLKVRETVASQYDTALPADARAVLQAYADGVNYFAALHPDKVAHGLLPMTGRDVAAGFVFRTPFFYGLDHVFGKIMAPVPKAAQVAMVMTGSLPIGSNGIAVAGSKSADGATRLLVNSHQPYVGPVAWYEAVLDSGQGWHVAGGFFPGSPFMLHGHNAHLGWANTVNNPNVSTVYRLDVNPANPDQYRLDGHWKDFEKGDAAIRVKIFGPLIWTVHRPFLWSAQGPVFKTDHGMFAVRYAGMGEVRQSLQYYRLNKAANRDEWLAAMRLQALPSINYIYADEKGNIGYVYNGQFPVRAEGRDWTEIQPGDRSDLIWHGYLPFERVPQIWNPKSGYVFNSNNTPFVATGPEDALKPADFSATMGIQTGMTNRAYRAQENYGADMAITAQAFRAYKFDTAYSERSNVAREIAEVIQVDAASDNDLRAAQALLKNWDRRTNVGSRAAALAVLMSTEAAHSDSHPDVPPIDALRHAIDTLKTHFGRIDPQWGQVNRIRRGKLDLAIDGGPDTYRAVYGVAQNDGTLSAAAGDTFIMFVTWDKAGSLSSESINQFGSATLDSNSRHYADQTPLFVAMKTKPVLFTQSQLAGNVEADYRPGDREKAKIATPY